MQATNVSEHHVPVRSVVLAPDLECGDEMYHALFSVSKRRDGVEGLAILRHLGEADDPVHVHGLPLLHE